jgi:glycosyltransferase involved in cell wall biosynthesis
LTPGLFGIGGIQRYNRMLVRVIDEGLREVHGHLTVISLDDSPGSSQADVAGLAATTVRCCGGSRLAFLRWFVARALRSPDVVIYGHLGFVVLAFLQPLMRCRGKKVLVVYGIEAWKRRGWIHGRAVRGMDAIVAISEFTRRSFAEAYGLGRAGRQFLLPNAVSPLFSIPMPAPERGPSRGPGPPVLLSISRLDASERAKGIDTVIRALPALIGLHPSLTYRVVGDGRDRSRLAGLAAEVGVSAHVEFLGVVDDAQIVAELRACSVFVLPSTKEGFGFVFIEAMALGKPVVGARAGAVPEVVADGVTGLLVDAGDVDGLRMALTRLLSDDVERARMGSAGRQMVTERYSYEQFRSSARKILAEVSGGDA